MNHAFSRSHIYEIWNSYEKTHPFRRIQTRFSRFKKSMWFDSSTKRMSELNWCHRKLQPICANPLPYGDKVLEGALWTVAWDDFNVRTVSTCLTWLWYRYDYTCMHSFLLRENNISSCLVMVYGAIQKKQGKRQTITIQFE